MQRLATILLPFLLALPPALAQDTISLAEVVRLALEHHPSIGLAQARLGGATAAVAEAESQRRPSFFLGAQAEQYQKPMLVYPIHAFTPEAIPPFDETLLRGIASVSYDLYQGGARRAQIDSSGALALAESARADESEQTLIEITALTYLRILGQRDLLAAHESRLLSLGAEQDRVAQLLAVGRAAPVERVRVEAVLAAAEAERASVVAQLEGAVRDLARLTGLPAAQLDPHRLTALVPAAPLEAILEGADAAALAASPRLQQAREELAAAERQLEAAGAGHRPRLSLRGSYRGFAGAGETTAEWDLGLDLGWSLWDGGGTAARIVQAEAARDARREAIRLAEKQLLGELDRARVAGREAAARVQSLSAAVTSLEEVVRIEALRLSAGSGVQTEYLDAEAQLLETRSYLTTASLEELASRVTIARTTGRLDLDWIRMNLPEGTP